jgi:hypothetical protein
LRCGVELDRGEAGVGQCGERREQEPSHDRGGNVQAIDPPDSLLHLYPDEVDDGGERKCLEKVQRNFGH